MRRIRNLLTAVAVAVATLAAPSAADAAEAFTMQTLHFKVTVGPNNDKVYDIVGDLYLPTTAGPAARVPAILTTNGFGGSKNDQAGTGERYASRGYAVLSYSGLGFGGSDGKITLDDPDFDGKAASQLVDYFAGKPGIAFLDDAHTQPAPVLDAITLDAPGDPRIGTVGGSYGGGFQFALAGRDHRVDAIVPLITWNDLSYSLGPNNTDQTFGVTTNTPGAVKINWGLGFSVRGMQRGFENVQTDPSRILPCPNFADWVCPALVQGGTLGYLSNDSIANLRHASVASYMSTIKAPTLLIQGEQDTLFNLNEAAATYKALTAQGTTVKMIWQNGGHSGPSAANESTYLSPRIDAWFARYLKGDESVDTGPPFAYFRNWVAYGSDATPAFGVSGQFPVANTEKWFLSGAGLTKGTPTVANRSFITPAGGLATSTSPVDALGGILPLPALPEVDVPGTFTTFTSPALTSATDVVGSPIATLKVNAPTAATTQGTTAGKLTLFLRIVDIGPDGKGTTVGNLVAPVRIPDVRQPFTVTMPGIVHRFAPGHKIRLVVAGGSVNYRGGLLAHTVNIWTGSTSQALTLPVVP